MSEKFNFKIEKRLADEKAGALGRAGVITTPHGQIQTPSFVVVGTKATVKAMTPEMLESFGAQVVLANTYHLYLQPGSELIAQAGGFAKFMNWSGPTMTDSGGFQVFSLGAAFGEHVSKVAKVGDEDKKKIEDGGTDNSAKLAKIDEDGVTFKSHLDGSLHRFTPESSMKIQWDLGADMIFAFDECTSPQATHEYQKEAMNRTHRWAKRCLDAHEKLDQENVQALFGVVQGGRHEDLRKESAEVLSEMKTEKGSMFDGFGIGGSFDKDDMGTAVAWVNKVLPEEKPRHLLGIGDPLDILEAVENGCDLFDCVAPTRIARNGSLYTKNGNINITNSKFRTDFSPIEADCKCYTCKNYTKAYLAHLFHAKEILANTLASVHNVYFIVNFVTDIRTAILENRFQEFKKEFLENFGN